MSRAGSWWGSSRGSPCRYVGRLQPPGRVSATSGPPACAPGVALVLRRSTFARRSRHPPRFPAGDARGPSQGRARRRRAGRESNDRPSRGDYQRRRTVPGASVLRSTATRLTSSVPLHWRHSSPEQGFHLTSGATRAKRPVPSAVPRLGAPASGAPTGALRPEPAEREAGGGANRAVATAELAWDARGDSRGYPRGPRARFCVPRDAGPSRPYPSELCPRSSARFGLRTRRRFLRASKSFSRASTKRRSCARKSATSPSASSSLTPQTGPPRRRSPARNAPPRLRPGAPLRRR